MKLSKLCLVVVLCACSVIACKNSEQKNAEEQIKDVVRKSPGINVGKGSFTIDGADGWTKKDTNYAGLQTTFLFSPKSSDNDDFSENVNVVTEKVGDVSIDTYMSKSLEMMKTQLPSFNSGTAKDITVDGTDAKMIEYTTEMGGRVLAMKSYALVKNGIAYNITCCSKKGELGDWEAPFDEAIKSFHVF